MNSDNTVGLNRRERTIAYLYVIALFTVITTVCCLAIFVSNRNVRVFSDKMIVERKMARLQDFQRVQSDARSMCDSLYNRILKFNPGVQAKYDQEDIRFLISDLRKRYKENSDDSRYIVFEHIANFYDLWFNDRMEFWGLGQNIEMLNKNLQDCELGLQKKQNEVKTQN